MECRCQPGQGAFKVRNALPRAGRGEQRFLRGLRAGYDQAEAAGLQGDRVLVLWLGQLHSPMSDTHLPTLPVLAMARILIFLQYAFSALCWERLASHSP